MNYAMKTIGFALLAVAVATASGCSGKTSDPGSPAAPNEVKPSITTAPVTIKMYHKGGSITDQDFKTYFVEPVAKKYPNFTLEVIRSTEKGSSPEELLASGDFPDFIYTSNPSIPIYQDLEIVEDLNPLVKKFGMDLSKFQNTGIETMKAYDATKLVGLPLSMNVAALVYNKDVFDKFGVPYPKDKMSWDEVIAIARSLTRVESGVKYIGVDLWRVEAVGSQMALSLVDTKTSKATLNNDGWAKVLSLFKQVSDMPGYVDGKKFEYNIFSDDMAMSPQWASGIVNNLSDPTSAGSAKLKNWDLVTLPYVTGYEGNGRNVDAHMLMVSNTSKHKDEAFAVIQEVLSDEVQLAMAKGGRISPLKSSTFTENYLKDNPSFAGKHIDALFMMTSTALLPFSIYEDEIRLKIRSAKKMIAIDKKDINTVLRELQEESDKYIASQNVK